MGGRCVDANAFVERRCPEQQLVSAICFFSCFLGAKISSMLVRRDLVQRRVNKSRLLRLFTYKGINANTSWFILPINATVNIRVETAVQLQSCIFKAAMAGADNTRRSIDEQQKGPGMSALRSKAFGG